MPPSSPQDHLTIREPHPLARLLVARLGGRGRVLDFATGSGRNAVAIVRAGHEVVAIADERAEGNDPMQGVSGDFDAVVSTHGFLHGTAEAVAARAGTVAGRLRCGGLLFATFGSTTDARFGRGSRIDASTFAPEDGDESGVPHAYFAEARLRAILDPFFEIETLDASGVDRIAGAWAHRLRPLESAVHWFVIAKRR